MKTMENIITAWQINNEIIQYKEAIEMLKRDCYRLEDLDCESGRLAENLDEEHFRDEEYHPMIDAAYELSDYYSAEHKRVAEMLDVVSNIARLYEELVEELDYLENIHKVRG